MIRTIFRDAAIGIGGAYVVLCVAVIAGCAISDLFGLGKDHDRRGDDQ